MHSARLDHATLQREAGRLRRRDFAHDDVDEIRRHLGRLYDTDLAIELLDRPSHGPRERPSVAHRRIDAGAFALEDVRHGGHAAARADDVPVIVVLAPVDGAVHSCIRDRAADAGPGTLVLAAAGRGPVELRSREATLKTVVLGHDLVDRVAREAAGKPEGSGVQFTDVRPRSQAAAEALLKARRYVEQTVLGSADVATPLVLSAAARLLAATTLAAFPNTVTDGEPHRDRGQHRQPVHVRRAIDYIHEHAGTDIGISDVAAAVCVTPRALQYVFRRHLDTTPMAYLRTVRLSRAHDDLLRADRSAATVTSIAARWGFAHTGRFAVLYREAYGQSPHVTLRQ
ncbi:helix-turn-helix transcriptional regulator [Mycolicibacterium grossiae]|uniref:helix-turn-helix transcriptional regulator n=1 Tax=Mycolicibacterium grossiae TaxID=1552759 RepID=UPI0011F397CA|nr:helix-turn-helix transcriptional regulator [Mycolicibacterium grossiae]QEM45057.1 helix-turn-helix transcriptional regulator [Mycolicibacterium grossiae]